MQPQTKPTKRRGLVVAACLSATLSLFAAGVSAGVIHNGSTEQTAIRFGNARPFNSVGQIFTEEAGGGGLAGSGVYLGDRWMITAAHVVESAQRMVFNVGGQSLAGVTAYVHPVWDNTNLLAGNDLALVRLDRDVPTITPATRLTGRGDAGRFAAMIGFGHTGTADAGYDTATSLIKRGGRNNVDAVLSNRILLADFDSGTDADNAIGTPRVDRLEYLIAPGDSGGGLFVYKDRQWVLAGIHSFGAATIDNSANSDYGDLSGHSRILFHNRWIDRVITNASATSVPVGRTTSTSLFDAIGFSTAGFSATSVPEPIAALVFAGLVSLTSPARRYPSR